MTEIQHELIMPNKDLPFKMFLLKAEMVIISEKTLAQID